MKLLLIALLATSTTIFANQIEGVTSTDTEAKIVAKEFVFEYERDYEMALQYDRCDKANAAIGWIAEVRQLSTGDKANGCWMKSVESVDGAPIEFVYVSIDLCTKQSQIEHPDACGKRKLDFKFRAKDFTPRF